MSENEKTEREYSVEESFREFLMMSRKLPLSIDFFSKHVEITKQEFLLLFLIFSSLMSLFFGQVALEVNVIHDFNGVNYMIVLIGVIIGVFISLFFVDRVEKPIKCIKYILIISVIISSVQFIMFFFFLTFLDLMVLFIAFIIINTTIIFIGLMVYFKMFLIKTSVLERGRIWAYLFLLIIFVIGCLYVLTFITNSFLLIPLIYLILIIYALHIGDDKIHISFVSAGLKKSEFKLDIIKYSCFILSVSFIAAINSPYLISFNLVFSSFTGNIVFLAIIAIFLAILITILLGVVFDYFGRVAIMSLIIFSVALSSYIGVFQAPIENLSIAIIFSAYVGTLMVCCLLVGDSSTQDQYGQSLSISYLFLGFGMILGNFVRYIFINVESIPDSAVRDTTFMACIVSLMLLLNMRETLPRKEQNWKDFLNSIYIIHKSGLLIYDKIFEEDDEPTDRLNPSLISGGIIGIILILKEIVRAKPNTHAHVKVIDHGDQKLLVRSNNNNDIYYILVVKEELIIFRKKLTTLMEKFDKHYYNKTLNIDKIGVNTLFFQGIDFYVRKIFG